MGNVLSYSGLSTKIRAMQSRLINEQQLQEIVQLPGVPQVAAYLKRTPNMPRRGLLSMRTIYTEEKSKSF